MTSRQFRMSGRSCPSEMPVCRTCARLLFALISLAQISGCSSNGRTTPNPDPPAIRFTDVSASAQIAFTRENGAFGSRWFPETMGGGGAFIDYDNDGFVDILLVNGDW